VFELQGWECGVELWLHDLGVDRREELTTFKAGRRRIGLEGTYPTQVLAAWPRPPADGLRRFHQLSTSRMSDSLPISGASVAGPPERKGASCAAFSQNVGFSHENGFVEMPVLTKMGQSRSFGSVPADLIGDQGQMNGPEAQVSRFLGKLGSRMSTSSLRGASAMARIHRRFGPVFYVTAFAGLTILASVPFWPVALEQSQAWTSFTTVARRGAGGSRGGG